LVGDSAVSPYKEFTEGTNVSSKWKISGSFTMAHLRRKMRHAAPK
jgi:hypothetical protein